MPMTPTPKVLLLIPHLGGGGAEQVMSLLTQGLSPEKYELHLGLVTQANTGPEAMPSWVQIHALGAHACARRSNQVIAIGLAAEAKFDLVRDVPFEFSNAAAAAVFSSRNSRPGAPEWHRFRSTFDSELCLDILACFIGFSTDEQTA